MKKRFLFILPALLLSGCVVEGTYNYDNSEKFKEYVEPLTIQQEGVTYTKLNVGWLSGEVDITEGDAFTVKETNVNEKSEYLPLYYFIDGETVNLQYCKSGTASNKTNNNSKKLEITIPSSVDYINLDLVSAVYKVDALDVKELSFDVVSGVGTVNINTAEEVKLNSVSGGLDFKLKDSTGLKTIDIDMVSGNVQLYFDGVRGYDLKFDTVSGSVSKDFVTPEDESLEKFKINFDSVSGTLLIRKIQKD